ncbi:MAG: transglutaminase domain-containing protein [Schaedlerella sp.]|nr:transglutaminase domain-containing protein [Schaedlerella sp.]
MKKYLAMIAVFIMVIAGQTVQAEEQEATILKRETVTFEAGQEYALESGVQLFALEGYGGSYGAQLEDIGLEMYQSMKTNYLNSLACSQLEVIFEEPLLFEATIDGEYIVEDETYTEISNWITYQFYMSTLAFLYDYPEEYWLRGMEMEYDLYAVEWVSETSCIVEIPTIYLSPIESFSSASSVELQTKFNTSVDAAVAEILKNINESATNYEKAWEIRKWIGEQVTYHNAAAENMEAVEYEYAFSPYMVFVDDSSMQKAVVCEGYAQAMKILCDRFGIPCALVNGYAYNSSGETGAHMWNLVQMEDGNWYGVDITWDDNIDESIGDAAELSSLYFMAGGLSQGLDLTFAEEHQPEDSGLLIYPAIYDQKYELKKDVLMGDINFDNTVNALDAMRFQRYMAGWNVEINLDAADLTGDGSIQNDDVEKLLKTLAGW